MSKQNTIFYKKKQQVTYNFSAEEISTDGAIFLSEKIERKHRIIKEFSRLIPEYRDEEKIEHSIEKMIKQRVFLQVQGYEDCNDEKALRDDPLIKEVLDGELASQPTLSRLENSLSVRDIYNISLNFFLEQYVLSIPLNKKRIVIDVDGTDDETHGSQQYAMFNGFYEQFMYSQLLFHDGETGQVILPVLRPGNSHSNRWFVHILRIIVKRIRERLPDIEIWIRADSGYSGDEFYRLAKQENLKFAIGMISNKRLKRYTKEAEEEIREEYLNQGEKHQYFTEAFEYKADSWDYPENCYAKVESTGKGMNIRYFCSNIENHTAEEIYWDFYVKRGEASENRIKELKNMCYSDRLSCPSFTANYLRMFISSLCYEFFRMIRELIKQTGDAEAGKWQVSNIRLLLMKVGATLSKKKRHIRISFSKSYVCKDLFIRIVRLC
jgi:hypothetical protein